MSAVEQRERQQPATVLVTGASTGLGLALAHKLIASPHRLILTARAGSLPRFAIAGIHETERVHLRALDVTSAEERRRVVVEADARWGGVDVLINNAGIAYRACVEHFEEGAAREQMEVNLLGPMDLARLVLPRMRAKHAGRILNISSVGGMMAMPAMSLYSASKFALEGATEALWYEVRPWGIKVSLIQPGFIHSESFRNTRFTAAGRAALEDPAHPYHAHYRHMDRFIARLMDKTHATPEHVADAILRAMTLTDPPLRIPATWDAHLFALLRRLLPRLLYHWLLYRSLPHIKEWGR